MRLPTWYICTEPETHALHGYRSSGFSREQSKPIPCPCEALTPGGGRGGPGGGGILYTAWPGTASLIRWHRSWEPKEIKLEPRGNLGEELVGARWVCWGQLAGEAEPMGEWQMGGGGGFTKNLKDHSEEWVLYSQWERAERIPRKAAGTRFSFTFHADRNVLYLYCPHSSH